MARWALVSLTLGIIAGWLTGSLTLGWVCLGLGVILAFVKASRPLAVISLFLALGLLLTVFRLARLYAPAYGAEESYTLKSIRLVQAASDYFAWQGQVIAPQELAGATVLVYSDTYSPGVYSLKGRLQPPVRYRNPGQGWHYLRKLYAGEIGTLSRPKTLSCHEEPPGLLEYLRDSYRTKLIANIADPDSAALALALTVGDKSLLAGELKASVYLTGVGHLLAMSGLHVGIFLGLVLGLCRRLGLNRIAANVIAGVFILFYLFFAGPSPSLIRAVLMAAWGIAALALGRESQAKHTLAWVALFMLLYNPLWLFDYAFIFSFLATFICLCAAGSMAKLFRFLPQSLRRAASVTIIIQLAALPLTLYLFGRFSLWAPLANLVLIPLTPALAMFSLLAGVLPGPLGLLAALPARYLLKGVAALVTLLSQFPLAVTLGGVALALVAVASGGLMLYLGGLSFKRTLGLTAAGLGLVVLIFSFFQYKVTTLWFLDVGQGESILIRSAGCWFLVDCGDDRAGENTLVSTLATLGVGSLDALILTHAHADHIGGLPALLAAVPVQEIYTSFPLPAASIVQHELVLTADIKLLSHNCSLANLNDTSLLVVIGPDKALLTGDIEQQGEILYSPRISPNRVLGVAHHGSSTSSSPEFLAAVNPQIAVISCGLGNQFGLPTAETLANLARVGATVLRTDLAGCVRIDFWPWGAVSITTFTGR